jgi:uncharacterized membrane protein
MGQDDWDVSHQYDGADNDQAPEDHEHLVDVLSYVILALAAVGLLTLLPLFFGLVTLLFKLGFLVLSCSFSLLFMVLSAIIGGGLALLGLAASFIFQLAMLLLTWPVLLLAIAIIIYMVVFS